MTHSQDNFMTKNLASINAMKRLTLHCYSSYEKLTELNMAASKALMANSFRHAQHLLDVRKPEELVNLQLGLMVPLSEKTIAYGQHVYSLATDISSELGKALETKMVDLQKNISDSMTRIVPSLTAGSNESLTAIK